jgi:hypothetical protein
MTATARRLSFKTLPQQWLLRVESSHWQLQEAKFRFRPVDSTDQRNTLQSLSKRRSVALWLTDREYITQMN